MKNKETRKNKILSVLITSIILTSALLVGGCLSSDTEPHYVKGSIEVFFKSNVTQEKAEEVVASFNCSADRWHDQGERLEGIVNVPEGEEKKYVKLFENHTTVNSADLRWVDT